MAKNKSDVDRKEKEQDILAVARRLFVDLGYDATSMGRIAEDAGVAPNTLYWYFADKDALLIAVLDQLVSESFREFEKRRKGPLDRQVLWLLSELKSAQRLIATVHARAPLAPALETWHTNFHRVLEATLLVQLGAHGVAEADVQHAARVAIFVIEGMLAHPTSAADQRAFVHWLVNAIGVKSTHATP